MAEAVRVSTRDYVREEVVGGEPRYVRYRGDLSPNQAVAWSRSLSFWPWGRVASRRGFGRIAIDNRDGRYDQTVFRDLRDQRVTVDMPTEDGGNLRIVSGIVDSVVADGDLEIAVSLRDTLSLLDVPLQPRSFGDEADPEARDRPLPVLLGVARSVSPVLWRANEEDQEKGPQYRVSDGPLSGVFQVRSRGEILDPLDTPPEWEIDQEAGLGGIVLADEPAGLVTLDASSSGDAFLLEEPEDALGGAGEFESFPAANASNPTNAPGWLFASFQPPTFPPSVSYVPASSGARFSAGSHPAGLAILTSADGSWSPKRVLEAGKTYRWTIRLAAAVTHVNVVGSFVASEGRFVMRALTTVNTQDDPFLPTVLFTRSTLGSDNVPGVYTGIYTVPPGQDRYVQLCMFYGGMATVADITFVEIPPPPPDALDGITLRDYALEVVRRSGQPDDLIVADSIDEVDPSGAQIGFYADAPITALAVLEAPLDSFSATVFSDREGRLRFARMRDPEPEIPTRSFTQDNLDESFPIRVRVDGAEGLTTTILARRNWHQYRDSDFDQEGGFSPSDRERLKRPGRFLRKAVLPEDEITTGGPAPTQFPRVYRHAINAEPLVSVFDDPDDAAAEIQRVVDIYSQIRFFVEIRVLLDVGDFVELDEVVRFTYPRFGLDNGRHFIVTAVRDAVELGGRRRGVDLVLWG